MTYMTLIKNSHKTLPRLQKKMLDNGFEEIRISAPAVIPSAWVFYLKLRVKEKKKTVKTEWNDSFWLDYVFETSNVQIEI